ncbi:MAG: hypothetical protein ACXW13_00105 [Burkholderiaceae bacterium]
MGVITKFVKSPPIEEIAANCALNCMDNIRVMSAETTLYEEPGIWLEITVSDSDYHGEAASADIVLDIEDAEELHTQLGLLIEQEKRRAPRDAEAAE